MAKTAGNAYQSRDGLQQAVVDLVRVGSSGHGAGVRQLASRLLRALPPDVSDPDVFRSELHKAMSAPRRVGTELRFGEGATPMETDTARSLADVDVVPNGDDLTLGATEMSQLEEVVAERRAASRLREAGISPTRSVLLSGPPGVGKTMTARWLASSLEIPLVTLDLASVVSSYVGSSGRNIKAVLDYARSGECVLLLDEFDAIAKRRDDDSDVGELRRVVNVVLVELDRWPDTSLLVAATNHPQLLDSAAQRRFDRNISIPLPGTLERTRLIGRALSRQHELGQDLMDLGGGVTQGMSSSDVVRLCETARRRSVLADVRLSDTFLETLVRHCATTTDTRDRLIVALHDHLRGSNRQIAELVGVTHPTVATVIRKAQERA